MAISVRRTDTNIRSLCAGGSVLTCVCAIGGVGGGARPHIMAGETPDMHVCHCFDLDCTASPARVSVGDRSVCV